MQRVVMVYMELQSDLVVFSMKTEEQQQSTPERVADGATPRAARDGAGRPRPGDRAAALRAQDWARAHLRAQQQVR